MATTVLTGAGASCPLGYPTTIEFFPSDGGGPNLEILQLLKQEAGDPLDVEEALAILQPIIDFGETRAGRFLKLKRPGDWWEQIESFTTYTRDRCFELYGADADTARVGELYEPLLQVVGASEQRVALFTTNYDPVTDELLSLAQSLRLPSYDGFDRTGWWHPSDYGASDAGLDVYRLHGSMSWVMQGNRIKNTRDYSLRRGKTEHLLIYPGFKGNPGNEAHDVYAYAHNALRDHLLASKVLIAIGFSFRDEHINRAVAHAFKKNDSLRLVVVNPEWPKGLQSVLGGPSEGLGDRVVHERGRFGEPAVIKAMRAALTTGRRGATRTRPDDGSSVAAGSVAGEH